VGLCAAGVLSAVQVSLYGLLIAIWGVGLILDGTREFGDIPRFAGHISMWSGLLVLAGQIVQLANWMNDNQVSASALPEIIRIAPAVWGPPFAGFCFAAFLFWFGVSGLSLRKHPGPGLLYEPD